MQATKIQSIAINMNLNRVACTLLLTCLVAAEALGFDHLSEDDALRSKRRARDKSSSIVEYMERLRNSLSDEHGKPRLDTSDAPTEVWAMQDTGKFLRACMHGWSCAADHVKTSLPRVVSCISYS